ncbi:hypothetical protein [Desulfogranum marinum]|uniref:hypothetical protein n=1 Tax=Desulfogranum marinum TaxID=453220 RepID=UPI001963DF84|nr:hypothetical protein [Desulfogranum marinum]MBM9514834.1 hypothetical protein [Desulfogranum marinum]
MPRTRLIIKLNNALPPTVRCHFRRYDNTPTGQDLPCRPLYDTYAFLIEPYATTEREGYSFLRAPDEFYQAIDALKEHASDRATAVKEYLNE